MSECPTHFYKYRSLAEGHAEYVERIVCHDELYFPAPYSFNDPFDCSPLFSYEASKKEMNSYYQSRAKKRLPSLNREQRRRNASEKFDDWKSPKTQQQIQELLTKKIKKEIGVLCLCEVNNDILMWSHYADSHRGICLEFDGFDKFFASAQKVIYSPTRPTVNPMRQCLIEMLDAALLTKAEGWSYEYEYRIVQNKGPGICTFPAEALTGITLGTQISEPDTKKVIGWIQGRKKPIKLSKAFPSKTFSLDFEEMPITRSNTQEFRSKVIEMI